MQDIRDTPTQRLKDFSRYSDTNGETAHMGCFSLSNRKALSMITVWRFPLDPDNKPIEVPRLAKPLTVQVQGNIPCLWMAVDTETAEDTCKRTFLSFGTGYEMPNRPMKYIGTYQLEGGRHVKHVFELLAEPVE